MEATISVLMNIRDNDARVEIVSALDEAIMIFLLCCEG